MNIHPARSYFSDVSADVGKYRVVVVRPYSKEARQLREMAGRGVLVNGARPFQNNSVWLDLSLAPTAMDNEIQGAWDRWTGRLDDGFVIPFALLDEHGDAIAFAKLESEQLPYSGLRTAEITKVMVDPLCRGKGAGFALLDGILALAFERFHAESTNAYAYVDNAVALKFFGARFAQGQPFRPKELRDGKKVAVVPMEMSAVEYQMKREANEIQMASTTFPQVLQAFFVQDSDQSLIGRRTSSSIINTQRATHFDVRDLADIAVRQAPDVSNASYRQKTQTQPFLTGYMWALLNNPFQRIVIARNDRRQLLGYARYGMSERELARLATKFRRDVRLISVRRTSDFSGDRACAIALYYERAFREWSRNTRTWSMTSAGSFARPAFYSETLRLSKEESLVFLRNRRFSDRYAGHIYEPGYQRGGLDDLRFSEQSPFGKPISGNPLYAEVSHLANWFSPDESEEVFRGYQAGIAECGGVFETLTVLWPSSDHWVEFRNVRDRRADRSNFSGAEIKLGMLTRPISISNPFYDLSGNDDSLMRSLIEVAVPDQSRDVSRVLVDEMQRDLDENRFRLISPGKKVPGWRNVTGRADLIKGLHSPEETFEKMKRGFEHDLTIPFG